MTKSTYHQLRELRQTLAESTDESEILRTQRELRKLQKEIREQRGPGYQAS